MSEHPEIQRAVEIVNATEWDGDLRVNMTTVIGAGRVLAKALAKERQRHAKLVEKYEDAIYCLRLCKSYGYSGEREDGTSVSFYVDRALRGEVSDE